MKASRDIEAEQALLSRALQKDPTAVRALVRYLEPKLLLKANAILSSGGSRGPRKEAMDLVQAAWRDLIAHDWKILRQWDPERKVPLISYVGVVAANRMISELRKESKKNATEESVPAEDLHKMAALIDSLEGRVADREYLGLVVSELRAKLTAQGETAFEVLYLEGLSVEEAIEQTGLTRESLYSYRRRIKKMVHGIAERLSKRTFLSPADRPNADPMAV